MTVLILTDLEHCDPWTHASELKFARVSPMGSKVQLAHKSRIVAVYIAQETVSLPTGLHNSGFGMHQQVVGRLLMVEDWVHRLAQSSLAHQAVQAAKK